MLLCASDDDTVQVIDPKTGEVVKTLPSGADPELFILAPSGNPLYIANEDDNLVTVVDIEKDKVLASVPVGVEPEGMGISPDGKPFSSIRRKRRTWRISSTPRPMRSSPTCWWTAGRASPNSRRTASSSG